MRTDYYLDGSLELILTVLCPPLGLISALINLKNDPGNWRRHIICIAWGMAAFAYCYAPQKKYSTDIVRYYAYCEKLGRLPLSMIWGNGVHGKDSLYVFEFVCWIAGKIGDKRLVPAVSTFCVYYIGLYVTCTVGEKERYSGQSVAKYVLFILIALSFFSIINNVRNVCAFALVGMAVFQDCYEKKRGVLTGALYVMPCLIHPSAAVFIIVRFMMGLVGRAKLISTAAVLVVPTVLELLDRVLRGVHGSNIIVEIVLKMIRMGNSYFHDDTSAWAQTIKGSGSAKVTKLCYMMITVIMLYYLCLPYGIHMGEIWKRKKARLKSAENFAFFSILLTLACIPMIQPQYWRFVSVVILFGGSIYLRMANMKDLSAAQMQNVIFLPAVAANVLWMRELLIYEHVSVMLIRSLICNPFVLLILHGLGQSIEIIG